MSLLNFSAAPIDPNEKINNPKKKGRPKGKTIKTRYVDPDATTYGDELFQSAHRPEATIVLKFHPLDSSCLRIETTGNYAIRYFENKDEFVLYCFIEPLENFEWVYHPPFEIIEENVETFGPFLHLSKETISKNSLTCNNCGNENAKFNEQKAAIVCSDCNTIVPLTQIVLKEKLMLIVKERYLRLKEERKAQKLVDEKLARESQEQTNEIRELLDEQLVTAGISDYQSDEEQQTENTEPQTNNEEQVFSQAEQEASSETETESKTGEAGIEVTKKIIGFTSSGELIYG